MDTLLLDGENLSITQVVSVARHWRKVAISPEARHRVSMCRVMVEVLLEQGEKVYGLTTGFGKLRDEFIPPQDAAKLQQNLIRSHSCGVGSPFPEDVVRAAILLRINTLCKGFSGIRVAVLEQLINLLNDRIYPFIPEKGSVGASGDLAPLSHLALLIIGDPDARFHTGSQSKMDADAYLDTGGQKCDRAPIAEPGKESFRSIGELVERDSDFDRYCADRSWAFRPITLEAKEGLALNNGTQFMTAVACLTLHDASKIAGVAEIAAALSLEAQRGCLAAYRPEIHQARNQRFQKDVASRVVEYTRGSQILQLPYLNSARLYRARHVHLADASFHLDRVKEELQRLGQPIPATVVELERTMGLLVDEIVAILPDSDVADIPVGGVVDQLVSKCANIPPREQIKLFKQRSRRARQYAVALLQTSEMTTFPSCENTPKVQAALVKVLEQLNRVVPEQPLVQDDYSFRCFPQVAACAQRALEHVVSIVREEINSATDNPLLFPPEPPKGFGEMSPSEYREWLRGSRERLDKCIGNTLGGGNFHGEPIAIAMDYLCIAMAELANISERRIAHLVDENHSEGLPSFLIVGSGLNSGFMIPQYTAASLVSENKVLCHPASVDSIPTCANTEDHVSMGTIAARKAAKVVEHCGWVVAIELLSAYQAVGFRAPLRPGNRLRKVVDFIDEFGVLRYDDDRTMYKDIQRVREIMEDRELLSMILEARLPVDAEKES